MKLTAAIVVPPGEGRLQPLLSNLQDHGFDEVLVLFLTPGELSYNAKNLWSADGATNLRVIPIRPDFALEVALSEARGDWVFIFYEGEELTGTPIRSALAQASMGFQATIDGDLRGFRCRTLWANAEKSPPLIDLKGPHLGGRAKPVPPAEFNFPPPTLKLSVILPTWRLGGLDVTLGALAKQVGVDNQFEVLLVDALYPWRKAAVESRLKALPFPVRHLPVDNSIFPVSSHSRFRNTAIRRAAGERLVFLSDYACPSPDFLASHIGLPSDQLAVSTWIRTAIDPATILSPDRKVPLDSNGFASRMTVWDVLEHAQNGEFLWSTFKAGVNPLAAAVEYERVNQIDPPAFPQHWDHHRRMCTLEYINHWKADSVSTEMVRKVNGWDESFDGDGGYADVDFSLRLLWAGVQPVPVKSVVRTLDAHTISIAPVRDVTRSNRRRLTETREKRAMRCVYGLIHGKVDADYL